MAFEDGPGLVLLAYEHREPKEALFSVMINGRIPTF